MSNELFGEVVKTISLDFAQKTSPVTVFAKQGDNRTRIIHIQPLMNGVPMNIDTSFQYVAKFAAKKPDGHYVYNDSAKINEDGTITVTLTDKTLAAPGNAICCIMLETQSGDVLSSQNFTLIVEFSAGAYKNLASSDEIMGLDDKLAQVQELIDKLDAEIKVLPPITPEDKDKVLTANEDGTAEWKDPKGGLSVTEITSPEEITADSPDGLYIQEDGSGGNGGGTTIHFYNTLDAVPADLPEGSFVAVPAEESAGGGGLPVVELETVATMEGAPLSEADIAKLAPIGLNVFILKVSVEMGGGSPTTTMMLLMSAMCPMEGVYGYTGCLASSVGVISVSIEFGAGNGVITTGTMFV